MPMKLFYCPACNDVVRLVKKLRVCECGKSFGKYEENGVDAQLSRNAILIGFGNASFTECLPSKETKKFDAYIIPRDKTTRLIDV